MWLQAVETRSLVNPRAGEQRLGEVLTCLASCIDRQQYQQQLQQHYAQGARIALLGVPEDLGPRANFGRPGAVDGWSAALSAFAQLQANQVYQYQSLLLLGTVTVADLQEAPLSADPVTAIAQLRERVAALDARVFEVLQPAFAAGYEVILIGGGHNQSLPLLQALADASSSSVAAINLDPHADFRALEGRHSGNGFSYAAAAGALAHYHVFGLHPGKNNADSLARLQQAGFSYRSWQALQGEDWPTAVAALSQWVQRWQKPLGIEVDLDAIHAAPASAVNYLGVSAGQAQHFVQRLAALPPARYLHLAEGAPSLHPQGQAVGHAVVGQLLSELVLAYLAGYRERNTP